MEPEIDNRTSIKRAFRRIRDFFNMDNISPDSEAARAVEFLARSGFKFGPQGAQAIIRILVEELGGIRLTFPDFADLDRAARNARIRQQFDDGAKVGELAQNHDLHPNHIWRILGAPEEEIDSPPPFSP